MMIKVCGLTKQSDVSAVVGLGAQMCGFIFHPKSARYISPKRAAVIQTALVKRVGVFVNHTPEQINEIMKTARLHYAQLHGNQSIEDALKIGADRVIRVLWPARYASIQDLEQEMYRYADSCSMFLLDAGTSGGGHGLSLDWDQIGSLCAPKPWLLAGGLSPSNITQALEESRPFGIDLNSGVEQGAGQKSPAKLLAALKCINC